MHKKKSDGLPKSTPPGTTLTCLLIQYVFAYCTFQNHWLDAGSDGWMNGWDGLARLEQTVPF